MNSLSAKTMVTTCFSLAAGWEKLQGSERKNYMEQVSYYAEKVTSCNLYEFSQKNR